MYNTCVRVFTRFGIRIRKKWHMCVFFIKFLLNPFSPIAVKASRQTNSYFRISNIGIDFIIDIYLFTCLGISLSVFYYLLVLSPCSYKTIKLTQHNGASNSYGKPRTIFVCVRQMFVPSSECCLTLNLAIHIQPMCYILFESL